MTHITWFGHSAFLIEDSGVRIIIDPFIDGNPSATLSSADLSALDIVLVTHDHGDHVGQAVQLCQQHNAVLGAVVETATRLMQEGVPQAQVLNGIGFNFGGTVVHKGVSMTLVPALHTSESGLPAGFIVQLPSGTTLYHAGDTAIFGDMALWGKLYSIDIACLPIGGVFTMDARQAAQACQMLQCKHAIPMHWGTFPMLAENTDAFKAELMQHAPSCHCVSLQAGESVTL